MEPNEKKMLIVSQSESIRQPFSFYSAVVVVAEYNARACMHLNGWFLSIYRSVIFLSLHSFSL